MFLSLLDILRSLLQGNSWLSKKILQLFSFPFLGWKVHFPGSSSWEETGTGASSQYYLVLGGGFLGLDCTTHTEQFFFFLIRFSCSVG